MGMTKRFFAVLLACAWCSWLSAGEPTPRFDGVVEIKQVSEHLWAIRFTRMETWRPHGFSLWPFPRKARVESWLYVRDRIGLNDVKDVQHGALPGEKTPLVSQRARYKGGVTMGKDSVDVEIYYAAANGSWEPFGYNGRFTIGAGLPTE